jgi:hypothetical protein
MFAALMAFCTSVLEQLAGVLVAAYTGLNLVISTKETTHAAPQRMYLDITLSPWAALYIGAAAIINQFR